MAYNNGIDGKALLDEISKVIDAAANEYRTAGQEAGEKFAEGVVDGIQKHSKDFKSEATKIFEEFNRVTNNFKSRKTVSNQEWNRVLQLSKELLKSERYADSVREKIGDIAVEFKNIGKVSGLENVLKELSKAESIIESVSWSEAGKNYRKRAGTKKTTANKPKVETPVVQADPKPVVRSEEKKQEVIKETTKAIYAQTKAAESAARAQKKLNDAQKDSKISVDINKTYDAVKYRANHEDEYKDVLKNGKEISDILTEQRKSLMRQLQPIREVTTKISEASSIKNIPFDALHQEAANVGQRLSTMYDEGITDTEEYIALQYKLVNILDRLADSAGGVKGSGAKSLAELHSWIFNSIAQDTGFDIGSSDAIDAIWGQGKFSIYGSDGKKRNMREIAADLIGYKGTSFTGSYGAYEDYNQLTKINAILKFIKENSQEAKQQTDAQKDSTQQEIDLINKKTEAQKEFNQEKKNESVVGKQNQDSSPAVQKTIGQQLLELENVTGLTITEVLANYDKLDDGIKEKANSILQSIGLMNDQMELIFSKSRGGNAKAVIGEDFVILQKAIETNEEYAESLINKLKEAQRLGINVAPIIERVFSNLPDESSILSNNLYKPGYEIQERASGKDIHINQRAAGAKDLNKALEENKIILSATDEQLVKFINDYIQLDKLGIKIDPNPFNFLYDAEKGFSFIDLSLKRTEEQAKSTQEVFRELATFLANIVGFNALGKDDALGISSGQVIAKIADAFEKTGIASRSELDQWVKERYDGFGTIYDGYVGNITDEQKTVESAEDRLDVEKQITAEKQKQNELIAVHGISSKNLIKSLEEGAFPSPSIALTKPDVYSGGYGDATVVFKKSAIDPANNPANKIYGVDAYTPTYPSFGFELNEEALKRAAEKTGIELNELRIVCGGAHETIEDALGHLAFKSFSISDQIKDSYLRDRSIKIETVEKDEPIQGRFHHRDNDEDGIHNGVLDIITRDGVIFDSIVNDDNVQKEYFDAIRKYVNDYNTTNAELIESYPRFAIQDSVVSELENRIKAARTDRSIYDEERAIFEHDQAVLRGERKVINNVDYFNKRSQAISDNRVDYINYVKSVFEDALVKPFVKGIDGQKFDRTPDGVAAAMASYGGKNALYNQDPFIRKDMDDQIFIIGSAKNYKSIAEAEADADRLEKDAPGGHTKLENGNIKDIARSIAQANSIEDQEAFDIIAKAVDGNTTAEAIGKALKNSGLNVDDDAVNRLAVAAQEAANVKTRYFEAKPQRALSTEDIAFVSLPSDSFRSDIIKEMLDAQGIPYVDHKSDDDSSRVRALTEGMQKYDIEAYDQVIAKEDEYQKELDETQQKKKTLQDFNEQYSKMSVESGDSDAFEKRNKALFDKANDLNSGVDYDQMYGQLIENENRYQQELEESARINKEREAQLDAYAGTAATLLSASKYDSISFDDKNKLFENFGNQIMQDGMLASDAMDQLSISMDKLVEKSKEMPDDIIENFGAENEKVSDTVSQLQKLSSIDLTRIFDSVDLKSFLQIFNVDQSNFAVFRTLFEELMQITKAMANGVDVGNAFNLKMEEITNTMMRLGGNMVDLDDGGYATMMQEFYKHMSNTKVQFNDKIKSDYTQDQWKSLYGTYKNRLTSDLTKGISADSLYHELSGLWPSLFPEGVLSQQDQFKLIFEKLDEARKLQADNWKVLKGFAPEDRSYIQDSVDNIYNKMSDSLFADTSANELNAEADALKEVEQNATKAANAKGKFAQANKKLGEGAAASSDDLDDEAESLDEVNRAASNRPDTSAYDSTTTYMDAQGRPYTVSGTTTDIVGDARRRTTDNYVYDAENRRWDMVGTVQTDDRTAKTRDMVQALEEYYKILNQIQKLRLDQSGAVHTEEINTLEANELVRAQERLAELGIEIGNIEEQNNLTAKQREALLDVELRARQEMYDVIAKMEDKQATSAAKPYQKTVSGELKKSSNIDTNIRLLGDNGASDRLQAQIADYRRLVDELVDMRLQVARNADLTNDVEFSNRFADTAKRAENARVAIEGVFKESQKLQKLGTLITTGSKDVSNVQNLKSEMIEFANSALDGEVKINGFNKEGNLMYATLTKAGGAVENITVALHSATGHLQAFSAGTSKATNEWEDFKTQAVQGAKNLVGMYVGFQEGVQALRTGVNYVKEIDLAMTELKKVTDETDESYRQFLDDASGTAAIIGSTISDFTEAAATFARLGSVI